MLTKTLNVEGMSCSHCAKSVENALQTIKVSSKVDLQNKSVQIEFDEEKVEMQTIKKAIEKQGYVVTD